MAIENRGFGAVYYGVQVLMALDIQCPGQGGGGA